MCLDLAYDKYISKKISRIVERHKNYKYLRVGYKIFCTDEEGLYFPYQSTDYMIPKKKWVNEKNFRPTSFRSNSIRYNNGYYKAGFHLFLNKEDAKYFAKSWWSSLRRFRKNGAIICKVYFDEVTRYGKQSGLNVVVAKKIYIPKSCIIGKVFANGTSK